MSDGKEAENAIMKKVAAFLADKPIWVSWLFHILLTGAVFGISYLVLYLLGIRWWAGVLILLAAGIIWGSVRYFQIKGKIKAESREDEKSA